MEQHTSLIITVLIILNVQIVVLDTVMVNEIVFVIFSLHYEKKP
jgi:hypothetical protein